MVKRIDKTLERIEKIQETVESPKPVIVTQNRPQGITSPDVSKIPPAMYKEKSLSTKGKLSVPAVLHIRDYMGTDVMELGMANTDEFLPNLLKIVKSVVWEDIDPFLLHEKELEEILVFIYGSNWDTVLQDYAYIPTDEEWAGFSQEQKDRYENDEMNLYCNGPSANIQSTPISNDFEEPMEYEKDGIIYRMRLPRIGDSVVAKEYADKQTIAEREDLMPIILADKRDEDLTEYITNKKGEVVPKFPSKDIDRYLKYTEKYVNLLKKAAQSRFILSVGDNVPESIEEGISLIDEIPAKIWMEYSKDVDALKFGMNPEVEVISPITKKATARRFRFQLMDLLPTV